MEASHRETQRYSIRLSILPSWEPFSQDKTRSIGNEVPLFVGKLKHPPSALMFPVSRLSDLTISSLEKWRPFPIKTRCVSITDAFVKGLTTKDVCVITAGNWSCIIYWSLFVQGIFQFCDNAKAQGNTKNKIFCKIWKERLHNDFTLVTVVNRPLKLELYSENLFVNRIVKNLASYIGTSVKIKSNFKKHQSLSKIC